MEDGGFNSNCPLAMIFQLFPMNSFKLFTQDDTDKRHRCHAVRLRPTVQDIRQRHCPQENLLVTIHNFTTAVSLQNETWRIAVQKTAFYKAESSLLRCKKRPFASQRP